MEDTGASKLVDQTIQKFKDEYSKSGPVAFWKAVMGADHFSVRQYLTQE